MRTKNGKNARMKMPKILQHVGKSGGGPPHSKTLSRVMKRKTLRQVLDCGGPPPLLATRSRTRPNLGFRPSFRFIHSMFDVPGLRGHA